MHIIFVCWGNICRSPAAEATFRKLVRQRNLENSISCDSVGTISQHQGNSPDSRMQQAARKRGIQTGGSARMVTKKDFDEADLLITMDHFNYSELSRMAPNPDAKLKIKPFCDYVSSSDSEVPDPYYGGSDGFEKVLDLLEDGCARLLDEIEQKI